MEAWPERETRMISALLVGLGVVVLVGGPVVFYRPLPV